MNVKSLIKRLKSEPQDMVLTYGFNTITLFDEGSKILLNPSDNTRVGDMLALLKEGKKMPFADINGKTRVYLKGNNKFELPFGPTLYSLMFHGGPARFGGAPKLGARKQSPS